MITLWVDETVDINALLDFNIPIARGRDMCGGKIIRILVSSDYHYKQLQLLVDWIIQLKSNIWIHNNLQKTFSSINQDLNVFWETVDIEFEKEK